jgi:3-deoxy-D-manno-octulosonate 8-phosphate phosphatase KdsC-like HAD superfamily phosphatase
MLTWAQTVANIANTIIAQVDDAHARGKTVAIYTSRTAIQFPSRAEQLEIKAITRAWAKPDWLLSDSLSDRSSTLSELPVVIFPGNVGDETALAQACNILTVEQNNKPIRQTARLKRQALTGRHLFRRGNVHGHNEWRVQSGPV